jgi:hypothetical protein
MTQIENDNQTHLLSFLCSSAFICVICGQTVSRFESIAEEPGGVPAHVTTVDRILFFVVSSFRAFVMSAEVRRPLITSPGLRPPA